jgi:hypothetical protein
MATLTSTLGYAVRRPSDQPLTAHTAASRSIRTGLGFLKVGAALAIATAALGFAVSDLGAQPMPAGHAMVTPAPHRQTVLGHGTLPALQLPTVANG